ncbi:hypothetical protein NEOLI_004414 [Neolecta irregularis DAH-3]|uniref:Uncharacterized protein n=1 Tax=Neolecta irregularis (strain DAH-3) TaxID=1198029 RepID=A0A1U7LIH6_NEOID|nr:hypothetical protein NEOLI_004414 [Neolecta irregularis DAH-3]|eukprot:OLL22455.1 hypothetical protein NEOLI_004414 [Neolecta irregularis DAH-3]
MMNPRDRNPRNRLNPGCPSIHSHPPRNTLLQTLHSKQIELKEILHSLIPILWHLSGNTLPKSSLKQRIYKNKQQTTYFVISKHDDQRRKKQKLLRCRCRPLLRGRRCSSGGLEQREVWDCKGEKDAGHVKVDAEYCF